MLSGINNLNSASPSEISKQVFSRIDTNSDGAIVKTEIVDLIQQNMDMIVNGILGKFDTDQDGIINQIESDSGLAKLGQGMKNIVGIAASGSSHPAPPEKIFDTADTNKDGVVSKEELSGLIRNGGIIDKLFSKVDSNSDGLISFTEGDTLRKQIQQKETANSGTNDISGIGRSFNEDETPKKQIQQKETTDSAANDISGIGQGWKNSMFNALLKILSNTETSSGESTSLYT